jgi:hypothetical protein
MTTLEIDTDRGYNDYEQQVRDMETHELIALAQFMAHNPTPYQLIHDELDFRKNKPRLLESSDQSDTIRELLG